MSKIKTKEIENFETDAVWLVWVEWNEHTEWWGLGTWPRNGMGTCLEERHWRDNPENDGNTRVEGNRRGYGQKRIRGDMRACVVRDEMVGCERENANNLPRPRGINAKIRFVVIDGSFRFPFRPAEKIYLEFFQNFFANTFFRRKNAIIIARIHRSSRFSFKKFYTFYT